MILFASIMGKSAGRLTESDQLLYEGDELRMCGEDD
jgi:hypothetical protein